ncbi:hypothetical protein [Parvibaculum sp.]|uniref:hypothetical protein n=1 Tax=Parvibaculum sp. TaxID=2024848 RepID=UPI001B0E08E6|nr:hypothetical protein [Parvibaculum sp.]MBO6667796.1 hypothetical protein [Parvibaculum sp.]MBO6690659.1 hypothetical protein [Parvibaculum sp.]MBO6714968.1 hypothetical protein [Parvibaculum sp.]
MISGIDARQFGEKIASALERVARDIAEGDAVHEDPTSGQIAGRIKEALVDFETETIAWQTTVAEGSKGRGKLHARSLTSKVVGSEEDYFGADLVICLDIETPETSVRKGFFVQSKSLSFGRHMTKKMNDELREQCRKMVSVTAASIVFLYSEHGIHVVPASAVLASQHRDIYSLSTWSAKVLFHDFSICWFGDPYIQATDPKSLESLRRITRAREALLFRGRPNSRPYSEMEFTLD